MWVFVNDCFFSVIQHNKDPELVLIRGRIKGDLEKLKEKYLPNLGEIVATPTGADYPYRALAWKVEYAEAVKKIALGIDYTNFKSSVKDPSRHTAYMRVWGDMKGAESHYESPYPKKKGKGKGKQSSFNDYDPLYRTGYSESLDLEASRSARDRRLADRGSQKLACKIASAEAERSRKHLEEVISKQLKGGPDDFDKDFVVPGTDQELEAEVDLDPTGQWAETSERIFQDSVAASQATSESDDD